MNVEAGRAGACTRTGQRDARSNDFAHAPSFTDRNGGQRCSTEGHIPSPELDICWVSCQPNLGRSTTLVTACISTLSRQCDRQQHPSHATYVAGLIKVAQSIPMMSIKAAQRSVWVRMPFLWHCPSCTLWRRFTWFRTSIWRLSGLLQGSTVLRTCFTSDYIYMRERDRLDQPATVII